MRSTIAALIIWIAGFTGLYGQGKPVQTTLDSYNVVWQSQSKNSSESMPVGGKDTGLNVWVEKGDLLFYIARSGSFDENNEFLKLGRARIQMEPNILFESGHTFQQKLDLETGKIVITAKSKSEVVKLEIWVDVFKPEIHVEINGSKKIKVKAFYENWRTFDRYMPLAERHSAFSYSGYLGDVYTYKDSVDVRNQGILGYHRNRSDKLVFDYCVNQQGMLSAKSQMVNTQKDLTFGIFMSGSDMRYEGTGTGKYVNTPFRWWELKSKNPNKRHHILIRTNVSQSDNLDSWIKETIGGRDGKDLAEQKKKNIQWWSAFWDRSHIFINTEKKDTLDTGWQVGRNYQLFRYMLACNAYGRYPTKFNGGLFTYDPAFVVGKEIPTAGPDFRKWGGGSFTAQNQRLVYWPMLKSGDFDMMPSQFNFYSNVLINAELRSQVYWGHNGACFTEQTENFGLPFAGGWGFDSGPRKRDPKTPFGEESNAYVKHHYTTQIEFAYMILKYYQYSGNKIDSYLPFVKSALDFFFQHYEYRHRLATGQPYDESGKLVIFPSTAAETYKNVCNPTDICSGLQASIHAILQLPDDLIDINEKKMWRERLSRVPALSFGKVGNKPILIAAHNLPKPFNVEIPELYPVFPYEQYGIGIGGTDLQVALNTWLLGTLSKNHISWHQDNIFCARMGLTEEAKKLAVLKLQDSGRRFPAFWGPGHDYVPDHNWGGSGMIGLQDMLLVGKQDSITLLPAWPNDWVVDFKLHLPDQVVVYYSNNVENNGPRQITIVKDKLGDVVLNIPSTNWSLKSGNAGSVLKNSPETITVSFKKAGRVVLVGD